VSIRQHRGGGPNRTRRSAILAVGPLAALLVLAVGDARAATATVAASNYQFTQAVTTIHVGDSVTWSFAGEPHTVTSGTAPNGIPAPDGRFDSGVVEPGGTFTLGPAGASNPFSSPGTYPYFCRVHPEQMTGTIVVVGDATPPPNPTPRATPRATAPPASVPPASAAPTPGPTRSAAASTTPTATATPPGSPSPSPTPTEAVGSAEPDASPPPGAPDGSDEGRNRLIAAGVVGLVLAAGAGAVAFLRRRGAV
jgi:plastocyanin